MKRLTYWLYSNTIYFLNIRRDIVKKILLFLILAISITAAYDRLTVASAQTELTFGISIPGVIGVTSNY